MTFGSPQWQPWILNSAAALPLLKHAFDLGINSWDTADVYSHGESERIIGNAIQQYKLPRQKLVIMTKCYFPVSEDGEQPAFNMFVKNDGDHVNSMGLSRKHIFDAVDTSTSRLRTYIDLLQIHRLDRETDKTEIMRALNDVIESGKGMTNVSMTAKTSSPLTELLQSGISERHPWQPGKLGLGSNRWHTANRPTTGNFKRSKTLPKSAGGTNSYPCKTITTSSSEKKSVK